MLTSKRVQAPKPGEEEEKERDEEEEEEEEETKQDLDFADPIEIICVCRLNNECKGCIYCNKTLCKNCEHTPLLTNDTHLYYLTLISEDDDVYMKRYIRNHYKETFAICYECYYRQFIQIVCSNCELFYSKSLLFKCANCKAPMCDICRATDGKKDYCKRCCLVQHNRLIDYILKCANFRNIQHAIDTLQNKSLRQYKKRKHDSDLIQSFHHQEITNIYEFSQKTNINEL